MSKILVIDNDDLFRQYLSVILRRAGYEVRALSDGAGFLDAMKEETFDAVVTDLFMPEVDGIEVVINANRQFPGLPVIGVTGARTDGVDNPCIAAMIRLGAVGVLRKPVDKVELLTILQRVLDRPSRPC
jgi:CheY-like chemotaxis protein